MSVRERTVSVFEEPEQRRLIPAREPGAIIEQALKLHNPTKAFVLFSGGKDSSVTLDYLWREHREIVSGALHLNTGIGIQSTRDFAREFCEERGIPFHQGFAPIAYEDLVRQGWWNVKKRQRENGFPGSAAHLFSYAWLKERALDAFVSMYKNGRNDRVMLLTGVRAEESIRRMGTCVDVERDGGKVWVAPLIDYTARDMQEHRTFYSVPMSPASTEIHISGECLCGAFGQPSEIDLIGGLYDDPVVPRIRALEKEMECRGVARCKWGVNLRDDEIPTSAPRLCVNCYKQPTLPSLEETAA